MAIEYGFLSYTGRYESNTLIYGNEFTPTENITLKGLRGLTASNRTGNLRIGNSVEVLKTITGVQFYAGQWTEADFDEYMELEAGTTYIVQVEVTGSSSGAIYYNYGSGSVTINSKIAANGTARWGGYPGNIDSNCWAGADIVIDTEPPVPPTPPVGEGFNIYLMNNTEELNKISKTPTEVMTLTGFLRERTNIIDPKIIIEYEGAFVSCNYMYIPEFNRYYFINNIESVRNNLWEITAHCDVLKTYSEAILAHEAVIARSESKYNLYLNDDMFKVYTNPRLQIAKFPNKFTGESYVLVMNGAKYT